MTNQLKMRRVTSTGLPDVVLPPGYRIRSYEPGDEAAWADIINRAGDLGEFTPAKVRESLTGLRKFRPEGLLFVVAADGSPVATACAWQIEADVWRAGQLHMVAVVPEHRGRRLSYWVSAAVCHMYRRWGVPEVYLQTDEFRKAAVKVYIDLDFLPVIRSAEHYDRWIAIYREYGRSDRAESLAAAMRDGAF